MEHAGVTEALLIEKTKPVYRYLLKIGVARHDAEDIIQETLYKAFKNRDSLDGQRVSAWLFRVALNDYYNQCKRRKCKVLLNEKVDTLESPNEALEEQFLVREQAQLARETLECLKPKDRKMLLLKYFFGLSYKDIARIMDLNEQGVKVYLYRARKKFKKAWCSEQNKEVGIKG